VFESRRGRHIKQLLRRKIKHALISKLGSG
jgi:hypothetical protein